jgi:hypothetical protein
MRMVSMVLAFMLVMVPAAMATEYIPGATYGQVSPDRVLAERTEVELVVPAAATYSPEGRYGFYQVTEQCCPERVLAERYKAAAARGEYLAYTTAERYPMWGCCGQVSPDRVFCERCGLT